jgi:hypothetical protein
MCSTPNPVESVFCVSCGARLMPLTAGAAAESKPAQPPIKGLTLLAKPAAEGEPSAPPPSAVESANPVIQPADGPATETPMTEEPPIDLERVPDWLERLRAVPPPAEEAPKPEESAASTPEDTVPPAAPTEKDITPPAAPVEERPVPVPVPDWLRQPPEQPAAQPSSFLSPETEIPDWLKPPKSKPGGLTVPSIDDKSELPIWLKDEAEDSGEGDKPVEAEKPLESLFESLEEEDPAQASGQPKSFFSEIIDSSEEDEIPDWLRNAAPGMPTAAQPLEPPSPEQVPDWVLKFKPTGIPIPETLETAEEPIETAGPLEGLRGILPIALAITEPHPPPKTKPASDGADGGQIFESILATPANAAALPAKPPRFVLTIRPLIYVLLLLAVVVPFFLPSDLAGTTVGITRTAAAGMFDAVQQRSAPNSTVVIAFDYDPSQTGEMDLIASAMVRDLVKRRVNIIAVSTLDAGPQLAQRVLDAAAGSTSNYAYGSNYAIVYLPGHEAGLSNLVASGFAASTDFVERKPIAQLALTPQIKDLRDAGMIVELAGSEDSLRLWMEQVQPHTNVPIVAAVSAGVEPKALTYVRSNQLAAEMGGMLSAAQYEVLSSQPGLAVISVNAQTAAQWVLALVIILGNLTYWFSRARGTAK